MATKEKTRQEQPVLSARLKLNILALILFLFLGVPLVPHASSNNRSPQFMRTAELRSKDDWNIACIPDQGAKAAAASVVVVSVTTNATKAFTIEKTLIANRSTKTVAALRLSWRLFDEGTPDATLLRGRTEFIGAHIEPNKELEVRYVDVPFVSIKRQIPPSVTNHRLLLGIAVEEVFYSDGSVAKVGKTERGLFRARSNAHTARVDDSGCAKQYCRPYEGTYQCETTHLKVRCSPSPDGNSCTTLNCPGDAELEF
jgi:hypothetical protein